MTSLCYPHNLFECQKCDSYVFLLLFCYLSEQQYISRLTRGVNPFIMVREDGLALMTILLVLRYKNEGIFCL